jgi:hypothetical protein
MHAGNYESHAENKQQVTYDRPHYYNEDRAIERFFQNMTIVAHKSCAQRLDCTVYESAAVR